MNAQHIIQKEIEKIGSTVILTDGEWSSVPFKAILRPMWRKKSSNFEKRLTELGGSLMEYYQYIGAASHCITDLTEDALLIFNDEKYEFKHRDKVISDNKVLYYTGILRKLKGDDNDEYRKND